jgi:hypothetical protein
MITAVPSFVWHIDLKELRARFPNAAFSSDEQTELTEFLRKEFEFELPAGQRQYSRMNIHLECEAGADDKLDFTIGGEFGETNKHLKNYPVPLKAQAGGKEVSGTIGVGPGLVSFYPKISRLHDSVQDSISFKVRVKYMS